MPFKGCRVLSLPDEKLLALLPVAVLPQLVLDEPVESAVVEYEGTLVFVDVSGFSSVACRLQQFTDDGAEQLSFHLNRYFAQLIAVVKRHHGDIIFFSGDAMMVAWSGVAPGDAAAMSILCGDALLAETGRYSFSIDADGGPPVVCSMSLHIGGASGKFAGLTVGGKGAPESGQWKFLVTGEPVELAGIAAASGADGELVVSSDLARLAREAGLAVETAALSMVQDIKKSTNSPSMEVFVSSVAKTELKRTLLGLPFPSVTCHPTPLPAHAKEKAALFVWDTVIQAAESLQSHGELRTVSTVFIKFVSIDSRLPPAELQAQIDAALGEVQKELAKVGGVLNKVVLDDKGLICLCLFGIPLHGHESDAYRALQFSLKAGKKMIKACSCVTAIGISRAVVFCGMTGSDQRNEYTVLGDGVNIAARLMMKAEQFRPGKRHIIIDEDTAAGKDVQKVSCHGHAIVEGDSLLLKGQDRPIMCYHVVNECDRAYAVARVQNGETDLPSPGSSLSSGSSMYSMSSASSVATRKSTLSHASKRSATAHLLNRERDVPKKARVAGKPGKYLGTIAKGALAPDDDDDEEAALYEDAIPHGIGVDKASSFRGVVRLRRSQRGSLASSEEDDDNLSVVSSGGLDFVGREVELDAVSRTVMDWARGQTADKSVILAGEARIGKTRLLAVATDRIKLPVVTLACSEASQRDQYGALSPVILRLSLETAIAKQPRLGELQQHLPLLHHIVRIAAVPLPGLELTTLAPREKEAKTNAVVLGLLKAQYGSPLVLVVDDLQWLDEASASFVADAFEQPWVFVLGAIRIDLLRRECMVSSCRSSCANGSVDSSDAMLPIPLSVGNGVNRVQTLLVGAPQTRTIAVLPFCVRMTSEIVKRVLGCQAVEPTLAQLLHEKSDGLPGCLVELLGNLREEGHVLVDLTGKAIRNLTADESSMVFDRSVMEASIMTIVDRLKVEERKVLSTAAVLGLRFPCYLLVKMMESEGIDLQEPVSALFNIGILVSDKSALQKRRSSFSGSPRNGARRLKVIEGSAVINGTIHLPNDAIYFVRCTARDVIYSTVLARERRKLHLQAAAFLLPTNPPPTQQLAHHFIKGQQLLEGWPHVDALYKQQIKKGLLTDAIGNLAVLVRFVEKLRGKDVKDGVKDDKEPSEAKIMEWVADTALCLFEKGEIDSAEFNARLATEALAQAAETALSTSGFGTDNSGLQKQLTISTESSALQKQDSSFLMAGVLQSYDSLNSPTVSIESVPTNIQSTSSFLYPAAQQENQLLPPTCGSPRTPCSISSASSTNSLPLKCILRSPPPPPAHGALQAEGTAWTAAAPPPPAAPPAAAPAPRRRKKSLHPGSPRVAAAKYNPDDDDDDDADDDEADSADSASDCKKARERPPEKEKKSAFSRLFCCFGGARQVKAGAPAPAGPAPAEEDEEGLQKVTSLLARSKQPYVPPGHAKRVSIALSRRSRKVSFNEHSSAVPSPWKQVLMLRVEIAFFRGDDDLVTCLDDAEDAGCDVSGVKEGLAIMNGCFLKETSSIRVLRNSPLAIMAVAAHAEALGAITIDEDDLIVREPLDLNPIPTTSTGMPNRPSLRLGYLSVRAIVRLFCGDAKGVYDDCVLLKDSSVSDPRTLLYATLLRSYANLWYSETAFPDDEAWKALREADLSQAVADARHISDRFLQMLGATRADLSSKRGEKAEALVRRGAGLVTPYHALACVAVLDKLKKHEGLRPQAERLLELLDTVSTSFPFARPAFLYYRGVIVGGGTRDFLSCLEICSENEWFASPFAFCAAVRLLSPQGTSSNVLVSIFLAQLSERSESPPDSDQVPAVRLAVLAKQAHLHPPEYSILKSMLSNEKSRKA